MTAQTQIAVELTDSSASSPAPAPPAARVSDFEAAWDDAALDFADDVLPAPVAAGEPSVLSGMAQRSSEIFAHAVSSLDFNAIHGMSAVQAIAYMTQHQIDLSYAKTLMDLSWGALKSARQSVDTVMNSK